MMNMVPVYELQDLNYVLSTLHKLDADYSAVKL